MDEPDHALVLAFWSLLAEERADLAGGRALANASVPYLLANAAWFAQPEHLGSEHLGPEDLGEVAAWYEARDLPPAVVLPSGHVPKSLLRAHGFALELSFAFRAARHPGGSSLVEQVSWTQMRYAGELLAARYGEPGWALAIGSSLSRAMQASSSVGAFLSYRDAPVGAMVGVEDEATLAVMLLADPDGALETRLGLEAAQQSKRALVLEALPAGEPAPTGWARWSRARADC